MQLLDLPNELLLKVFEYGETDALIGGPSQACHRLREISDEPDLWHTCLAKRFRMQYLTPLEIEKIPSYREWCLKQRVATRRTTEALDVLVNEMREASPEDIEAYTWQILKLRLRAVEGLEIVKKAPRSIAHYHWAHWLTEIMYRLEGVHRLLKLSTMDDWGNGIVERPIDQVIALYSLRNGRFPKELFNVVYFDHWLPSSMTASENDTISKETNNKDDNIDVYEAASELAQYVFAVFRHVSTRDDFLAVLGRGALFVELAFQAADQLGWHVRLLKMSIGSYVCIQPKDGEAFFVDFQREGKLRTLEELRDRLNQMSISGGVQNGISLYNTLATSYVWHTAPTSTRHCVLDLIEHAANDVKVTHLSQAPRLYANLVRRIIKRNIAEIENAPISRAVSSASLASMAGAVPGGWLRRGKVVRVLAHEHWNNQPNEGGPISEDGVPSQSEHLGVVLEVAEGSVLVLKGSETIRVIKQMLQPTANIPIITIAGLQVPDIGADLCLLGQYFLNYNTQIERFE